MKTRFLWVVFCIVFSMPFLSGCQSSERNLIEGDEQEEIAYSSNLQESDNQIIDEITESNYSQIEETASDIEVVDVVEVIDDATNDDEGDATDTNNDWEKYSKREPVVVNVTKKETSTLYLLFDDSASLAEVGVHRHLSWESPIYPWQFLKSEKFDYVNQDNYGVFNVSIGLNRKNIDGEYVELCSECTDVYELGVNISSSHISKNNRNNAVITILLDTSESMESPISEGVFSNTSILPYLGDSMIMTAKRGLTAMWGQLKEGDIINIVTFNSSASVIEESFSIGDNKEQYDELVERFSTSNGFNMEAGIKKAYEVALRTFDVNKDNRIIAIMSGYHKNTELNLNEISNNTIINGSEGIYFSGVGLGIDHFVYQNQEYLFFNEEYLKGAAEAGKGAYFSVASNEDVDRIFSRKLYSLLNVAARNVRVSVDLPNEFIYLQANNDYVSGNIVDIKKTNYSYNTSQYFFEVFGVYSNQLESKDIILTIEWKDPVSLEEHEVIISKNIGEIIGFEHENIVQARVVTALTHILSDSHSCSSYEFIDQDTELTNTVIDRYINDIISYCLFDLDENNECYGMPSCNWQ